MQKDFPLISVIVPVYNVSEYLEECLLSLLHQTYANIEILVINDGSTDDSGKICNYYSEYDNRIKYFTKKNGGLSDARNYALDRISGDYITFVDSDDIVDVNYIKVLVDLVNTYECDIASVDKRDFYKITELKDLKKNEKNTDILFSRKEAIKSILRDKFFTTSAWGKLYKASLFKTIRFPKGKIYEDLWTTWKVVDISSRIIFRSQPLYFYRTNPTSIMNSKVSEKNMDFIEAHKNIINYVKLKYPDLVIYANQRFARYCSAYLYRMWRQEYKDRKAIEEIRNYLKKNLWVFLKSEYSLDKKIFAIIVCTFPGLLNKGK